MNTVYLESIGVVAPGISDWPSCRDIIAGSVIYETREMAKFSPPTLPANERRRITPTIRLAMQAATEAMQNCSLDPVQVATVFASSHGDLDISARICHALSMPERPVSPTDFHNSVHNAPSGYWSIGSHCHMPSTSLSAGEAIFSAGLVETVTQVLSENIPCMLVAYDQPPPDIYANAATATQPFAAALVITQQKTENSIAALTVQTAEQKTTPALKNDTLESIRSTNSAAQALLLLELVAGKAQAHCLLPYHDNTALRVSYSPC